MASNRRPAIPLDPARLEALALAYVARFSTTAKNCERYLRRKLRERGWDGPGEPPLAGLIARFVSNGFIDDAAFARARTGGLLRRGYGQRRIGQALGAAGIAAELRDAVRPDLAAQRQAALALARKRRFGPFGQVQLDRPRREKQIAAMLRSGHPLDSARELVDAASVSAAEDWAAQGDDQ